MTFKTGCSLATFKTVYFPMTFKQYMFRWLWKQYMFRWLLKLYFLMTFKTGRSLSPVWPPRWLRVSFSRLPCLWLGGPETPGHQASFPSPSQKNSLHLSPPSSPLLSFSTWPWPYIQLSTLCPSVCLMEAVSGWLKSAPPGPRPWKLALNQSSIFILRRRLTALWRCQKSSCEDRFLPNELIHLGCLWGRLSMQSPPSLNLRIAYVTEVWRNLLKETCFWLYSILDRFQCLNLFRSVYPNKVFSSAYGTLFFLVFLDQHAAELQYGGGLSLSRGDPGGTLQLSQWASSPLR